STGLITESGIKFSTFPQLSLISAFGTISQLDEIAMQLAVIDKPQKQVFIEARIVEIARAHSRSLGIQWGGSMAASMGSNIGPGYIVSGGSLGGSGLDGAAVEFPAADVSGSGNIPAAVSISLSNAFGTSMLNARLSALETQGKSKTLSNPKITTVNGSTAKIEKGWEIPYQTSGGTGGDVSIEFKNAVISLEVTPSITPDNMINMQIVAKKNDPDFSKEVAGNIPLVKRTLKTTVFIADGGTAVLGGVFENVQVDNQVGLPFFSDIPVLGWLFKSKSKTDDEKELLIFITPTIVKGDFS
ncbi:MAG: type IV pilus secretin PilQ, partial [Nitrospinota bacterium]